MTIENIMAKVVKNHVISTYSFEYNENLIQIVHKSIVFLWLKINITILQRAHLIK